MQTSCNIKISQTSSSHYFHRHCLAFVTIQYSSLSFQELSRKELRPLRQKLSSIRKMKRCGKRIQLHCDPDGNASITQQEWVACVLKHSGKDTFLFYGKNEYEWMNILKNKKMLNNVTYRISYFLFPENTSQQQLPVITKNPRGPNPLEKWLKAD